MLIFISAAKSLNLEAKIAVKNYSNLYFVKEVEKLIKELKNLSIADLEKLMSVSNNLAKINYQRFLEFKKTYDLNNSKPALLLFDGDVFKKIAVSKFNQADFDFAEKHLRILSGLYGILKPLNLIQPYRLEMGTEFKNTAIIKNLGVKNLYQFWEDKIADYIKAELKNDKIIINLASEEYFKAINLSKIKAEIINIIFKEKRADGYKIIGTLAKKARGLMVNYIIKNKITDSLKLKNFKEDGYNFNSELSNQNNLVFVK
jgi:cytoplasmic iron level regulating protein YaaA (DUF328/UPF0246 family)